MIVSEKDSLQAGTMRGENWNKNFFVSWSLNNDRTLK